MSSTMADVIVATLKASGVKRFDVVIQRQEPSLPPKITLDQARGSTLWAIRSVLSGDGATVLEVARTNLRQLALE